jgi:hypothetical protein
MALIVGAKTFDRLFAGIRFDETDGPLLYVYAEDEETAAEIEDNFALHRDRASGILKRDRSRVAQSPPVTRPRTPILTHWISPSSDFPALPVSG